MPEPRFTKRPPRSARAETPRRAAGSNLQEYEAKRDLNKTAEPAAIVPAAPPDHLQFVVQKHESRQLHYDFRLEMNGVLKSWAVPKGLPMKSGEKRLAIEVEDHPVKYARFQGVIPPGNYGAGTVTIWDSGHYTMSLPGAKPLEDWKAGKLQVHLVGQRLQGNWTLVRTRVGGSEKNSWLILRSGKNASATGARARAARGGTSGAKAAGNSARKRATQPPRSKKQGTNKIARAGAKLRRPMARNKS